MRSFRHWTTSYIADRLRLMVYQRSHPDAPWLTASAVAILESWLQPDDRGIEWGSGRSTLWFARRIRHLVSVESEHEWHDRIRTRLHRECPGKVDYLLRPEEESFISAAETLEPASLDFALVDGKLARDLCALRAVSLVRPGGALVVDNIHLYLPSRSRSPGALGPLDAPASAAWASFARRVDGWRRIWTSNGVFDTCLWIKPGSV